jgi:hypothetical protein
LDVGITRDVDFEKGIVVLENGLRYTLAGEADDDHEKTADIIRMLASPPQSGPKARVNPGWDDDGSYRATEVPDCVGIPVFP